MEHEQQETQIQSAVEPTADQEPMMPRQQPRGPMLTLPVAIVVAGVLISGSVIYSNVWARNNLAAIGAGDSSGQKTGTIQYSVADLKKWGKGLKLDTKQFNQCLDSGKYTQHVQDDLKSGTQFGVQGTPSSFINGVVAGKSIFVEGALPYDMFDKLVNQYKTLDKKTLPQNIREVGEIAIRPDDHVLGKSDAPVAIVEYSDFQCPYCRMFFEQTFSQIKKNLIDTGKVRMIFRHFPLTFHPMAQKSAEAAECAAEQGKFWEMHDAIFTKQAE